MLVWIVRRVAHYGRGGAVKTALMKEPGFLPEADYAFFRGAKDEPSKEWNEVTSMACRGNEGQGKTAQGGLDFWLIRHYGAQVCQVYDREIGG